MSDFNENTRVQVPAALHLCKLGYTYLDDNDILAQLQSLKFNENVGKDNE
jgi:hypothetical protein